MLVSACDNVSRLPLCRATHQREGLRVVHCWQAYVDKTKTLSYNWGVGIVEERRMLGCIGKLTRSKNGRSFLQPKVPTRAVDTNQLRSLELLHHSPPTATSNALSYLEHCADYHSVLDEAEVEGMMKAEYPYEVLVQNVLANC